MHAVAHRLLMSGVLIALALVPSCALEPTYIVPEITTIGGGHEATVAVQASDTTNSFNARTIGESQVEDALTIAIRKSGLFSRVVAEDEADYVLTVHLYEANSRPGAATTAVFGTNWKLTEARTGRCVWKQQIREIGHGDAFESAFETRRRDLALERAARRVLGNGLRRIRGLRLSRRGSRATPQRQHHRWP